MRQDPVVGTDSFELDPGDALAGKPDRPCIGQVRLSRT